MATLTEEIDKYAKNKKLEIETLKVRETYRKEFIGNVSHELKRLCLLFRVTFLP